MRIVQINLQPDYGGAEKYTLMLSDGLRSLGHDVTLLCHPQGRLRALARSHGISAQEVTAANQLDIGAALHLGKRLRSLKPDIVHLQTPREYMCGTIAAKLAGAAVVATRHMLLPVKPGMQIVYRHLQSVVVLSKAIHANLLRCGIPESQIRLIYAGIHVDEFVRAQSDGSRPAMRAALGISDDCLLIGMAGRMVEGKGHGCLIDAASLVLQQDSRVSFILAGEGPLRAELEARTLAQGIADRVIFPGFCSNMPEFMAALDLCVMPSTCDDVMPLVLMEAMAAGRAVVATDVGSVRELIQHDKTGILVPAASPAATADAILRLIRDPVLKCGIAAAGQSEVRRCFTVRHMIEEIEALYDEILARSPTGDRSRLA